MDSVSLNSSALFTWQAIVVQLLIAALSLLVWRGYLSPLADIPGPTGAAFSRWWHLRHIYIGDQNLQLVALHQKHGSYLLPPVPRLLRPEAPPTDTSWVVGHRALRPHCPQ